MPMAIAYTETKARRFLTRQDQAKRYRRSTKTIKRWGRDPKMGMPPEYDFNGLPARADDELEAWERTRVVPRADDDAV
jgi:hypothetical protein